LPLRFTLGGLSCQGLWLDPGKIVVTGESAGGHLALMTGMLTAADGFDGLLRTASRQVVRHGGAGEVKVAAVVNFFGLTDLATSLPPSDPFKFRDSPG